MVCLQASSKVLRIPINIQTRSSAGSCLHQLLRASPKVPSLASAGAWEGVVCPLDLRSFPFSCPIGVLGHSVTPVQGGEYICVCAVGPKVATVENP